MTGVNRGLALALVLVLSSLSFAPAQAQQPNSPVPGIDITCANEETTLMLDSGSNGFSATGTCTIENPSTYSEEMFSFL